MPDISHLPPRMLSGCEQATAMFVARQMTPRMTIEKIEFDVKAVRDQNGILHSHTNQNEIINTIM
jgi:hypothetical protein